MIDLRLGDCLSVLPTLAAESVDAVLTDPPAGIGFMGKEWDDFGSGSKRNGQAERDAYREPDLSRPGYGNSHGRPPTRRDREQFIAFLSTALSECHRVARSGARLLCWAIPRTSHWTGTAIEDAGWIIEDRITHLFGQGFPKGQSKLKPAAEDWWLARKASARVPALEIDACRVAARGPGDYDHWREPDNIAPHPGFEGKSFATGRRSMPEPHTAGRWPANVCLSHLPECEEVGVRRVRGTGTRDHRGEAHSEYRFQGALPTTIRGDVHPGFADPDGMETVPAFRCAPGCAVAMLDAQAGERPSGGKAGLKRDNWTAAGRNGHAIPTPSPRDPDTGGPSRFYYVPKPSRAERGEGNTHPTVKSVALLRWLARLITPPGGLVLDPFLGSGSTALACIAEGFGCIGIEREAEYLEIAQRRVAQAQQQGVLSALEARR